MELWLAEPDDRVLSLPEGARGAATVPGSPNTAAPFEPVLHPPHVLAGEQGRQRVLVDGLDPVDPAPFAGDVAALREAVRQRLVAEKELLDAAARGEELPSVSL